MSAEHIHFPKAMSLAVHELRTPVTVVAGYLRMLLREQAGPLTEKQRKMLDEADRSCGRISHLIAEMSELGKLEGQELAFGRQEFELRTLVRELASGMHEGTDRGIQLELRGDEDALTVTGDRTRLSAALTAMMRSALRERGDPGVIVIECSVVPAPAGSSWAVVAIGDEATIPSLLRAATGTPPPFDEWRGGMGLALPVAKRVIEAHGGALWSADGAQSRAASAFRLPFGPRT